ncbi:hypothetical protein PAL_GLEAN10025183 [Pteropus alecto]|uniref:Uncharacterized protein n=1 Tax=Pteropus alecto TaxID=9402 RepID=L5JMD4_PTEAL|nr:hypothetical protein PAL_GLEAN10025183 [Pteropus alecto]
MGIISFSHKALSENFHCGIMEAQDKKRKREQEPHVDSDVNSESSLDSSWTTALTPAVEGQERLRRGAKLERTAGVAGASPGGSAPEEAEEAPDAAGVSC